MVREVKDEVQINICRPRELIPYWRLYRFGQQYDIFRILVNTDVPFWVYHYFFIFINK